MEAFLRSEWRSCTPACTETRLCTLRHRHMYVRMRMAPHSCEVFSGIPILPGTPYTASGPHPTHALCIYAFSTKQARRRRQGQVTVSRIRLAKRQSVVHPCMRAYMRTRAHARTHAHVRTCTHVSTHIHTQTFLHKRMQTRMHQRELSSPEC